VAKPCILSIPSYKPGIKLKYLRVVKKIIKIEVIKIVFKILKCFFNGIFSIEKYNSTEKKYK
tara:strand:- start:106 stop:291 length:186 start_codon:yes stop_codon:yes gene_type:complete